MSSTRVPEKIGVFYLLRQGNAGICLDAFARSLDAHSAGANYRLFIVAKGFRGECKAGALEIHARKKGIDLEYIHVSDEGFDLTVYRKAASAVDVDHCLFLNSYSRILGDHWLDKYRKAFSALGDDALVGASGSYASYGEHAPFPSAHIRTNAFFMRRDLFLALDAPLRTKLDCHLYESGSESLSNRISRNGGKLGIVDRHGHAIAPDAWPDAGVFCSGRQENLLVADNRTHDYQLSKPRRRWRLSRAAWGTERANILDDTWLTRRLLDIRWRCGSVVP